MFINLTNHPSGNWTNNQLKAAAIWGEIVDYPFPRVEACASADEIDYMAEKIVGEILKMSPSVVLCQGEFTLSYAIITRLKSRGVRVVAACSKRQAYELVHDNGTVNKVSIFEFVQFREY